MAIPANVAMGMPKAGRARDALIKKTDLPFDVAREIEVGEGDVYFFGDTSDRSFAGHVGEGLREDEAIELVRRNNPVLHHRLWGPPKTIPTESLANPALLT